MQHINHGNETKNNVYKLDEERKEVMHSSLLDFFIVALGNCSLVGAF